MLKVQRNIKRSIKRQMSDRTEAEVKVATHQSDVDAVREDEVCGGRGGLAGEVVRPQHEVAGQAGAVEPTWPVLARLGARPEHCTLVHVFATERQEFWITVTNHDH